MDINTRISSGGVPIEDGEGVFEKIVEQGTQKVGVRNTGSPQLTVDEGTMRCTSTVP